MRLLLTTFILFSLNTFSQTFVEDSLKMESIWTELKQAELAESILEEKELILKYMPVVDSLIAQHKTSTHFKFRKADMLTKLGYSRMQDGNREEAMKTFSEAIRLNESINERDNSSGAYIFKGLIWTRFREYEKAKQSYDTAYAMTLRNIAKGDSDAYHTKAKVLNMYATHYANIQNNPEAEKYFKRAIRLADSIGATNRAGWYRVNYAEVLFFNNRYDEALKLQLEGKRNFEETNDNRGLSLVNQELAGSYDAQGQHKRALEIIEKEINRIKKDKELGYLITSYELYFRILKNNKKSEKLYNEFGKFLRLRDSLRGNEQYKRIADIEANFRLEQQREIDSLTFLQEKELAQAKIEKRANNRFWIVVTGLLLLLGGVGFYLFRNRQKLKEKAYQNILLNKKVATKTEEINELLTETIQHIKSKERLAENLQKLSTEQEGITLKSIIADLKASKADNAKLMLIKQNIEQVNFEFIKKLKTAHPNLTKTDIEICSFDRIGLSQKEIANLRNTSVYAVKTARHRIKKKLDLTVEQSLDSYLNTL